jgi:phosphoglycolate phosphatase
MKPFDAVIIDLDGTMVDTLGDFVVALNLMLADVDRLPVTRLQVERLVGKGSEHLIKNVLVLAKAKEFAMNSEAVSELYPHAWKSYQRHYLTINGQHAHVFPGVLAGLQRIKATGVKMACLTNKPTSFALPLLKIKGLDGFFDIAFGGDAFERKKPDPLPLIKTCEALGTLPGRTLMIGDSSNALPVARCGW